MAKGYWITTYRSVSDPDALARYAGPATQIINAHGGRILARGIPAQAYEAGESQRCVVIESRFNGERDLQAPNIAQPT
jgi:uncharacterized protein (DUF1330 family)